MSPALERWVVRASDAIAKWLLESQTVLELRGGLSRCDSHMPYLNERERAFLRDGAEALGRSVGLRRFGRTRSNQAGFVPPRADDVARVLSLDSVQRGISKLANQMDRHLQAKAKTVLISETLQQGRAGKGLPDPTVFYLSTQHQKPAAGHAGWQGKLYVDRMWRSTLEASGYSMFEKAIEKRIRDDGIHTVQWAMGAPVWLVMRPYCRHRFIPIPLHEGLTLPLEEIKARHPEVLDHSHRSMTPAQARERIRLRRRRVRQSIERMSAKARSGA